MAAVLATLARPGKASTGDVLRWTGEGEQVYACRATDTHYQWVLERPAATLIDDSGRRRGIHGEGPSWHADDGSIVYARAITTIPSPNPDAVPWLVLRASAHDGAGILAKVDYILRTETKGGVAPATGLVTNCGNPVPLGLHDGLFQAAAADPSMPGGKLLSGSR